MKKPIITLVIASSLDGRIAFPEGGDKPLGSSTDKKMLNKSLKNIDATIFGSGTLKAHRSTFLLKDKDQISNIQPISIVAGNSNNFSSVWPYFQQPIRKWHINSSNIRKNNNLNFEKEFLYQGSWSKTLNLLCKEGIQNIALLGGGKLINSFAKEDLIDEIKITITPKIIGGDFIWIPVYTQDKIQSNWIIKSINKLETDELFIHYIKY